MWCCFNECPTPHCSLLSTAAAMQDATDEFNAIHSAKAKAMLKEYLIGRVGEAKAVQAKLPGIKEDEVSPELVPVQSVS